MMQILQRALLVLVVVNAWFLFGIIVFDYLFGNILGLFATSIYTQAWVILLLVLLSFSTALKATQQKTKQWFLTTAVGIYLAEQFSQYLGGLWASAKRAVHALYINLYLLADVVFCVGAPLLIVSASAGWWLLDEVSYLALVGYCCMISVIVFSGFYSNLVRLLSLGYFFGYWLLSESLLLYPFAAPALVQKNITAMVSGSGFTISWLPVVGLVLIVYLIGRREKAQFGDKTPRADDSYVPKQVLPELVRCFPARINRQLFGSYLSLFCLLMALPLVILLLNNIMGYLNPHILFAGFVIWILDRLWQADVVNEPALSSDLRYFVKLIWNH